MSEVAPSATETFDNNTDDSTQGSVQGQNIDYGKVLDTQQGMAALEQGKQAVMSAAKAVDQEQIAATASQLKEKAQNAAIAYNASVSSNAAGIDSNWTRLRATGVRVIDGDTIEVLQSNGASERVRMSGIDAPESDQLFGKQSTQFLEKCVAGKPITIAYRERDKYQRLIGVVLAGGVDCNYEQVKNGAAWHYKQYQKDQPSGFAEPYAAAEAQARNNRKGLWAAENPKAPWEYRHSR